MFVYLASAGPLVFGRRMRNAADAATSAAVMTRAVLRMLNDPAIAMMVRYFQPIRAKRVKRRD